MEDNNILPPLPDAQQMQLERIRPYLLDPRENYPEPYYMLEYKGVPFSTLGGIQALSGQKKNGKTFVLAQLMAAMLGTGSSRVKTYLKGLEVPARTLEKLGHLPKVLYVDTEMEKLNSAKVLRRVHWLCGWETDVPNERFHVMWLRGVTDTKDEEGKVTEKAYQTRYDLIKLAIDYFQPDAVFIDGIRDLIGDFNSNEESFALVTDLMALAESKNICIWNALHLNPRPSNDDDSAKMRGHLGTELGNKITDTLVSIKKKNDSTGEVTFTVKQNDARGKDMEDWKFVVTDAAGSLGIPCIQSDGVVTVDDESRALLKEADAYFKMYAWTNVGATYTDLERHLKRNGVTSNRRIKELFDVAMEKGVIYKSGKKYHYKGVEKEMPNDKVESLPFDAPDGGEVPY